MANKDELINENLPFVYHIIHKYYPKYIKDEDVIQAGMLGLVKSAQHFNPDKGKFSTYAGVIIRNEINRELKSRTNDYNTVSLDRMIEGGFEF